jgi:hypothetical protein
MLYLRGEVNNCLSAAGVMEILPDGTNDGASPRSGRIVDVEMTGELGWGAVVWLGDDKISALPRVIGGDRSKKLFAVTTCSWARDFDLSRKSFPRSIPVNCARGKWVGPWSSLAYTSLSESEYLLNKWIDTNGLVPLSQKSNSCTTSKGHVNCQNAIGYGMENTFFSWLKSRIERRAKHSNNENK